MSKSRLALLVLAALVIWLWSPPPAAEAQGATRTWVSGVGNDANPCSRTAPCKTFAGAISKTAPKGEIDALDPGGYGALTINKSITVDGGGYIASVLVGGTNGMIINAGANDIIVLRNLQFIGTGTGLNGIRFLAGGTLIVENVSIEGFTGSGIDFEPGGNSTLQVNGANLADNTAGGVLIKPGAAGSAKANLTDVFATKNGLGLRAEDRSTVSIRNSTLSSNTNNGAVAVSTSQPVTLNIIDTLVSDNVGVAASAGVRSVGAGASVRLNNVSIFNNSNGIVTSGGGAVISFKNNMNGGNTVSDGAPTVQVNPQ